MDLAALTVATFEPLVGESFTVEGAEGVEFTLESATASGEWPGGRDPFSLVFRGPIEPVFPQAIYGLRHTGLGLLEIFVVPIAQRADGVRYEAIFT